MKRIILYIILIVQVLLFSACDEWLIEDNPNEADAASYWENLDQTNATLTSAYTTLLSERVLNVREEAWRSDMAVPGFGRPTYSGTGLVWYSQSYNSTDDFITGKWEMLYGGIFKANQCIEGLEGLVDEDIDMSEWTEQMAQARFLRGLFHFYLYTSFNKGSIIIKDKVAGTSEEYHQGLSSAEDVRAFILEDMRYAYHNLPTVYSGSAGNNGRAAKGAAATILGTNFLYDATLGHIESPDAEMLDSAIYYFNDVINDVTADYPYELERDMNLLFTNSGELNSESILEITYNHDNQPDMDTWREDRSTNKLASYSTEFTSQSFFPSSWITWQYMSEEMDTLDERNYHMEDGVQVKNAVSRRAAAMVALSYDDETAYYQTFAHEVGSFNYANGVSRYKKYTNHETLESEADNPGGKYRSAKNVTINRLSDVYLMLAECYIHKSRLAFDAASMVEAFGLINDVRARWGLVRVGPSSLGDAGYSYDEYSYSPEELFTRLKETEKPLEMSVEGHCIRWFDLRRWDMLKSNFSKLSNETYYPAYEQVDRFDPEDDVKSVITISDVVVDPSADGGKTYVDYKQAAVNFNYDQHAWFAIPPTEIVDNNNLN